MRFLQATDHSDPHAAMPPIECVALTLPESSSGCEEADDRISAVAFSSAVEGTVVAGSGQGIIYVYDSCAKDRRAAIPFHRRGERMPAAAGEEETAISALEITPCGRFIAAGCGAELKFWRESPGAGAPTPWGLYEASPMEFRALPRSPITRLAMFCACRLCVPAQRDEFVSLIVGHRDGTVAICEGQTARDIRLLSEEEEEEVTQLSWLNFDARRFMAAFGNGIILVCHGAGAAEADGDRVLQRVCLNPGSPADRGAFFQLCPNGLAMAAGSDTSSSVFVFGASMSCDGGGEDIFLRGMKLPHPSPVNCVAWCPKIDDRATVAVGQEDGGIALWSVDPTGFGRPEHLCLLWGHPGQAVTHLEFSPAGDLLASAGRRRRRDGDASGDVEATVNVWCPSSRSVIQTFARAVGIGAGVLELKWLSNEQLVFGLENVQHLEIADIPTDRSLANFKFASAFRSALLGKGVAVSADFLLSRTTCFRHFAHSLGTILGEQHRAESEEANREERLKYSPLMQSLALLASEAGLDAVASSLDEDRLDTAPPEWSWLSEYCDAVRSLRALTAASPSPKDRRKQAHVLDRVMAKYMSSRGERRDPVFRPPALSGGGDGTGSAASSRPPSSGAVSNASTASNSSSSTATAERASALLSSTAASDLSSSASSVNATRELQNWSLEADVELMRWWSASPGDWQSGGRCDAFLFGAGKNGQLAEGSGGNHRSRPTLVPSFSQSSQIVCGANCTFVIHPDGSVSSCGEGSNGRLGLGNSEDHCSLTQISGLRGFSICQLATSVGWDGHALALATSGEVFSWGDGEDGKLGHGSDDR